jgi:similar to stage IV sporulation protein
MLARWMLDFWRGYLVVSVRGERVPELVNLATGAGIQFWDISRGKKGEYRLYMHREDVRRLRTLLRQTGTRLHLERKYGVPFLLWRAWRRKFFLAGALTFLIALHSLTSLIWDVRVEGDLKRISPETVEEAAAELGIAKGKWIGRLPDTDILQNQLLDKVPELAWVGVQVHGTKVLIQVVEKVPGVNPPATTPRNIVAAKKGTVREIMVAKGKAAVKRGDLVQPGQVLITGTLGDGRVNVHANGSVRAAVWYKSTVSVPMEAERKTYTGQSVEKQFLTFWGYPIQIWGYGKIPFEKMEEQAEDKGLKIGSFEIPIKYRHATYREVETYKDTLTEEEAIAKGLEIARGDVAVQMGKDGVIESQKVLHKELKDGKLEIQVLNVVVEDVGKAVEYAPAPDPTAEDGKRNGNT